ncbi:hypothetical protein FRC02_001418, partial [Tulasnella sp. 418]
VYLGGRRISSNGFPEEVKAFALYSQPLKEERALKHGTKETFAEVFGMAFEEEEFTVMSIGSVSWGAESFDSNIDLAIKMPKCSHHYIFQKIKDFFKQNDWLDRVVSVKYSGQTSKITVQTTARHGYYQINYHLNFDEAERVATAMQTLVVQHPALMALTRIVNLFLKNRGLHEPDKGGLGSFSVLCMILCFLNYHPQLNRVNPQERSQREREATAYLLLDFFRFYATELREDFGIRMSPKAPIYLRSAKGQQFWLPGYEDRLSVQNPFNESDDVTRNAYRIQEIRAAFDHAALTLAEELTARCRAMRRIRPPDNWAESVVSILGLIVRYPLEMLVARTRILDSIPTERRTGGR